MWEILLQKQEYLLFLAAIMVSSGIIKDQNYFDCFFKLLLVKIKSKRLLVFFTSLVAGVLPVPGRVSISAGILDTMASADPKSRSKFGIIDYLATHHYYLWSPLEKTIILPMAVLGLTYLEVLSYLWPLLLVTLVYIAFFIFKLIKENDIELSSNKAHGHQNILWAIFPLCASIGFLIAGYHGWIIFTLLAIYYMLISKNWKVIKYLNVKLLLAVFLIVVASNFISTYHDEIKVYIEAQSSLYWACALGFCGSFALGSSGKFIGIAVLLTQIFGIQYFTLFFAFEYAAYLISPTHKCACIGKMYFKTPFLTYAKVLGIWAILVILTGIIV